MRTRGSLVPIRTEPRSADGADPDRDELPAGKLHPAHGYFQRRYAWVRGTTTEAFAEMQRLSQIRPGIVPAAAARQLAALMDGLQV